MNKKRLILLTTPAVILLGVLISLQSKMSSEEKAVTKDRVPSDLAGYLPDSIQKGGVRKSYKKVTDEEKRKAWVRELMVLYGQPEDFFDEDTLYMIYAFQTGNEKMVDARMLELLGRDANTALNTMSKLDGSFMIFDTELPYTTVSDYLAENYTPDESMNMMGQMLLTSQSIREVGSTFFQDWAKRDPDSQLKWIAENPSFDSEYIFVDYFKQEMKGENAVKIVTAMLELSAEDTRSDFLVRESLQLMAVDQPETAGEILKYLPADDPLYYDTVGLVANNTAAESGETAMTWAGKINDPDIRLGVQMSAGSTFLANDPEGFNKWFEATTFESSQATREEILAQIKAGSELEKKYVPDDPTEGVDRRGLPLDPEKRGPVPLSALGNQPPTL